MLCGSHIFLNLANHMKKTNKKPHQNTKVGSAEEPRSAPLVPSICWTIFAKRLWQFWAQELEMSDFLCNA